MIYYRPLHEEIFDNCKQKTCTKGPLVTDNSTGEILCSTCGQVLIEKLISLGPEHSSFDIEQFNEKSRTGIKSSIAIHDMGLATSIGIADKDASGNYLSGSMKSTFNRLRLWDNRSKSRGNDRNLRYAFMLLSTMKSQLNLPDNVIEEAAYIYRKAIARKLTQGRGIASVIYASIYAACRKTNTPRTLKDIAVAGNLRKGDLALAYRIIAKTLDLKLDPYDPVEFVTRICSMIGTSEKTRRTALKLVLKSEEKGFSTGKNPMALVAAGIYLASCIVGEKKTQTEIARACGISNVSIRNLCGVYKTKLGLELEEK